MWKILRELIAQPLLCTQGKMIEKLDAESGGVWGQLTRSSGEVSLVPRVGSLPTVAHSTFLFLFWQMKLIPGHKNA